VCAFECRSCFYVVSSRPGVYPLLSSCLIGFLPPSDAAIRRRAALRVFRLCKSSFTKKAPPISLWFSGGDEVFIVFVFACSPQPRHSRACRRPGFVQIDVSCVLPHCSQCESWCLFAMPSVVCLPVCVNFCCSCGTVIALLFSFFQLGHSIPAPFRFVRVVISRCDDARTFWGVFVHVVR
jgi:hypothetical protein